jgi:hypothetical protein
VLDDLGRDARQVPDVSLELTLRRPAQRGRGRGGCLDLVGIYENSLRLGVIVLRTEPAMSQWVLFSRDGGGFGFARPDRIPGGETLEAHLAMRRRAIERARPEALRPNWRLDVTPPRESLADVLMQIVGRHVGEGRAPRSNRRVVRCASSGADPPDSGDDDPHEVALALGGAQR